jgi:hypothetical protein
MAKDENLTILNLGSYLKSYLLSGEYKKMKLYTIWQTSCIILVQKNMEKEVRNRDNVVGMNGSGN